MDFKKKNTSGMSESLAWVSSKLLKVTDAEARSQQLLHLIMIRLIYDVDLNMSFKFIIVINDDVLDDHDHDHYTIMMMTRMMISMIPSAAIKPGSVTAHVPKRKNGDNVVQIVSVNREASVKRKRYHLCIFEKGLFKIIISHNFHLPLTQCSPWRADCTH